MSALPDADSALDDLEADIASEVSTRRYYQLRAMTKRLAAEVKELNGELDQASKQIAVLESLREKPPKTKVMRPRKRKRGGKPPASFVALASDWHTCEIVTPSQTNGLNEHNQEIGTERAWAWAEGVKALCQREQETRDIETFVLWLGGDFSVHDGLHYKSERAVLLSPHEEARFIRDLLAQIITYLRAELNVPRIVIPTSFGNHDRSTERMIPGHAGEYSFIQDVYRDLESWFAATDESISFQIAESDWDVLDVHGYRLLFHHGHYVGYGAGLAGLAHPLRKTMAKKITDLPHDTLCIGHYHQQGFHHGGKAITNGSLVGANGYSTSRGFPSEPPAQVAFLIDHEVQAISNYFLVWGT